MNDLDKFLIKYGPNVSGIVFGTVEKLKNKDFTGLNVKKLSGYADLVRVKKGRIRMIFRHNQSGSFSLVHVILRDDNTYKNL